MSSAVVALDITGQDVALVPRLVLGGKHADSRAVGKVTIGRSEALLLRPGQPGIDPYLATRLECDSGYSDYYLVQLSCTFWPFGTPIIRAAFEVALRQESDRGVPQPVVWSMDPLRLTTPVTRRRTVSIGSSVEIIPAVLPLTPKVERNTEFTSDMNYVVAAGEGESRAEWDFTATPAVDKLTGVHHLTFIARTPVRSRTEAHLALSAKRRERLGGLITYRADIPLSQRVLILSAHESKR
jgi:hypothetical protein